MSLHARCQQRIAIKSAHRTVWRRRCVRYYASNTANDPEWFQKVRTELLSRRPQYHREELDTLHYEQFYTTLIGFTPNTVKHDANSRPNISLAELLTRFNVRVQSPNLLGDGTDPLHHPGEPWMRRMWAGGAVKLSPALKLDLEARSELPLRLKQRVACLERIKDVRLHGTGDEAKIFVTVERRFASRSATEGESEGTLSANNFKRAIRDNDWSDSLVKEERNLVFMKAKTAAELISITSGQGLGATRYLKALEHPDYSFTLTPTRSLLFRYSAVTYNAHLIHLDPTYARYVEGHRNTLVHGPLTLTLMLQVLNKHLKLSQIAQGHEAITSIEYRNIAPLYCDEEMRVCLKKKKQTDTGHSWDVWIEGPTGGTAVKAIAHTAVQSAGAVFANRPVDSTPSEHTEGTISTGLPDVQTVALQAQNRLHALDQEGSGTEQLSRVSRDERRKFWRPVQTDAQDNSPAETPKRNPAYSQFSRLWRKQWIGKSLRYLYMGYHSPLCNNAMAPRESPPSPQPMPLIESTPTAAERTQRSAKRPLGNARPYSAVWRKQWVGKAMPHLYLWNKSPLVNTAVVEREAALTQAGPAPSSPSTSIPETAERAPAPLSWRDRQRASLLRGSASAAPVIRTIETEAPEGILPVLNTASMQSETDAQRRWQRTNKAPRIQKVEGVRIRKADIDLKEAARRRAHGKSVGARDGSEGARRGGDALSALQAAQGRRAASE